LEQVTVEAVAYVTDRPVLSIDKKASPGEVQQGDQLLYKIEVMNIGQEAVGLVVTDTIPAGTTYVEDSASSGGQLVGDEVRWEFPVLEPGEKRTFTFLVTVTVDGSGAIENRYYAVSSAGGESATGAPVTVGRSDASGAFLPLIVND
jgi:uncharacterized repeat protein (TIGR01451 family)